MRHQSLRACLALACVGAAVPLIVPVAASQVVASSQVSLLVTVLAPKAPVTDLTAKDFNVRDGGQIVEVTAADHTTTPLSIELIVENTQPPMGVTPPTRDLRTSLQAFVKTIRAGSPDVQIGMFTDAGASVPAVNVGAPAADLDKAIDHLAPSPQTAGVLLESLVDASHALAKVPAPRRAIVTVDFAAPDPTSDTVLQSIESAVFQSGATLWSVSVSGTTAETPSRDAVLNALTVASGGHREAIVGSTGLQSQLKTIANSLMSQYTLRFARPAGDLKALKIETPKGKALVSSFMQ